MGCFVVSCRFIEFGMKGHRPLFFLVFVSPKVSSNKISLFYFSLDIWL